MYVPNYSSLQVLSGTARPATKDEIAARLSEVPRECDDLTARLMGDPRPGRSYLDKRHD